MREGSRRLADVLTKVDRPVEVSSVDSVPYAGVRWYVGGVYEREVVPASMVKAKSLSRIETGDIVYNRMWATKASFGVAGDDVDGCLVTNDFPAFRADPNQALSDYIGLLFESKRFQESAAARATGTTERRRLKEADFLDIDVYLPPLSAQHRIVDLIDAVDDAIESADEAHRSQLSMLNAVIDVPPSADMVALDEVAKIKSGASWSAANGSSTPSDGYRPVLTIVNTRPDGSVDLTDRTYVTGLSASVATVTASSLVMIRTNGNRSRIGNVYRAPEETIGDAVSAFQFVIELAAPADRDYLYWVLRAPTMQAAISEAASGSTGLGNVAAGWLKTLSLPWPPAEERERLTAMWESAGEAATAAADYATSLGALRSNLLTALLSGDHKVPESYDALLEGAV